MSEGIWVCREGFEVCVSEEGGESEKMSESVWVGGVVGGVGGGEGGIGGVVEVGEKMVGEKFSCTRLWACLPCLPPQTRRTYLHTR